MAILKFLINISLIFTTTAILHNDKNSSNDSSINYRLPDNVIPVHYNIKLIPYIMEDNFTFEGESTVNITIRHATQNLSLHVLKLTINETMTSLFNLDNNTVHIPTTYNYDNLTQILVLSFNVTLSPGNYTLKMRYVGILHTNLRGFFVLSYKNKEENDKWLAATQFEPTFARQAFPCWDEPALKATFDISIKHHRNYTALSNMPIQKQWDDNKDDMIWTYFDTTPIMSTYLVAFVVADYVRVPTEDETINIWCRSILIPNTKLIQDVVQKSKRLLTEYTNSTSEVPKIDLVALPRFIAKGMENWGLIILRETNFVYNESFNTISDKIDVAKTTVHEMAHHWFSNVVTPLWWSDVWLSEGFATFFGMYFLDQMFENWRIIENFVVDIQRKILHYDVDMQIISVILEVNKPVEILLLFMKSSYGKAPAIVRMLQHIITDEVFQNGLIKYLHKHQFNSTTSDDLWNTLQAVLDKSNVPHNAYRLKEVMDTWLKQSGFPEVHVTRNNDTNEIILTQEYFVPINESADANDNKWWIPLTFATQTNSDFSNTVPTHWLKPQDQNITIDKIDPNDWIIVNLQQMGYYRVSYDSSNWQKIADFLKSDNYTKIHVLNRAQLIDDAFHFMMKNKKNYTAIFLNIISYLPQETDFMPWQSMFRILSLTKNIYEVPENQFFKSYILKIFNKLIENVGYKESPTESDLMKLKRTKALKWACTLGHSECKRMATVKLNEYFTDPETHKISPNLKDWTYCNGLMEANISTWNKLYNIYVNKSDKDALSYLFCSENPNIIINFLNISISKNKTVPNSDYYVIYTSIIKKHAKNNVVIDYILTNYNETIPSKYYANRALSDIIDNVYSKAKLDKISKFVKNEFEEYVFKGVQKYIIKRKEELDLITLCQPCNINEIL